MCQQLFLLRHAEVEALGVLMGQSIDAPLSEVGKAQALRWRTVLTEVPFQAVISSPARRARDTAQLVAPAGMSILQLPHFHEMNWGAWEGKPFAEVKEALQMQRERWAAGEWDWAPPAGESLRALLQRAEEGLRLVSSLYPAGSVLIVTHGQWLRLFLTYLMGFPITEEGRFYHRRAQLSWLVRVPAGHFYLRALAVDADTAF